MNAIEEGFWIIIETEDGGYELCCEGAFDTWEHAQDFADAEVGAEVVGIAEVRAVKPRAERQVPEGATSIEIHGETVELFKAVEWSYPTSENANRFGFPKVGCWTVALVTRGGGRIKELAGFATKREAIEFANKLPNKDWPASQRYAFGD